MSTRIHCANDYCPNESEFAVLASHGGRLYRAIGVCGTCRPIYETWPPYVVQIVRLGADRELDQLMAEESRAWRSIVEHVQRRRG